MEQINKYESIRLRNQICFPLYACAKEIIRQYREPLAELNLTYTQYIVMMVLWESGSITEGELGKTVRLDSGTLAPLLKRLERQGYITRVRLESNERKLMVSLTEAGENLKDRAVEGCIDMPREELLQLKSLLEKAIKSMEE